MAEWLKHRISHQKRIVEQLRRDNVRVVADLNSRFAAPLAVSEKEAQHARISPRLIKAQRARLGLSREDFGKLLGASSHSVYFWETDQAKPREKVKAALAAVRKLGKREALQRLAVLKGTNGHHRTKGNGKHRGVKKKVGKRSLKT